MTRAILPNSIRPIHKDDLIRVGSTNDGGYVLTKEILDKTKFLLSFGLDLNWNFEKDFQERTKKKIKIHVYDHISGRSLFRNNAKKTIRSKHLKPWNIEYWNITFKYNFSYNSYKKFFDGTNNIHFKERVSHSKENNSVSIDKILKRIHEENIFFKMDIDGSEWQVIKKILENYQKFVGIVIEFHNIDIFYNNLLDLLKDIKDKFNIIHIHGNNFGVVGPQKIPNFLEITFENKKISRLPTKPSNHTYPIKGVDQPNNPKKPDFSFTFI